MTTPIAGADSAPLRPEKPKNTKLNITVGLVAFGALALLGAALGAHFGLAHLGFLKGHTVQLISKVAGGVGALAVIGRVAHSILQTAEHKEAIQKFVTYHDQLHRKEELNIQSQNFANAVPLKKEVQEDITASDLKLKNVSVPDEIPPIKGPFWNKTYTATNDKLSFSRTDASKAQAKSFSLALERKQLKIQLFAADATPLNMDSFPKTLETAYKEFQGDITKALAATFAAIGVTDQTPFTAIVEFNDMTYLANQGSNEALLIDYLGKKVSKIRKTPQFSIQKMEIAEENPLSILICTKDSSRPDVVGRLLLDHESLETVFNTTMAIKYPGILKQDIGPRLREEHAMMTYSPYLIKVRA